MVVISLGDQDEGTGWFDKCIACHIPYVIINQLTKEETYWPIRKNTIEAVKRGYLGAMKVSFTCLNNLHVMEKRIGCSIPNAAIHYNPYHIDRNVSISFPSMKDGPRLAIPARFSVIHKGQNLIIELLKEKKWRNRNITVNLYGDGPDEHYLKSLVQQYELANVHFYGRQKNLIDIWRVNHAMLLPSFMEGLPIVLVGAMVCARVPVVTDVGGHREVVEDNINGFIAATPSVASLDNALERAFAQLDRWEKIGKEARERILKYLPEDPVEDFVSKLLSITG
jgi:glycosyltransferase involved in cell wall biosynthesis